MELVAALAYLCLPYFSRLLAIQISSLNYRRQCGQTKLRCSARGWLPWGGIFEVPKKREQIAEVEALAGADSAELHVVVDAARSRQRRLSDEERHTDFEGEY